MDGIPFWTYLRELPQMEEPLGASFKEVLQSGNLILGNGVREFERVFAEFCTSRYAIGVDNGTNAIVLALRALGVGHGDEVVTTATTAIPTGSAIIQSGAVPVFVDIVDDEARISLDALAEALHRKPRAIVVVHLYGIPERMEEIVGLAEDFDVPVIEDCAQSHGARRRQRTVGTFGQLAAYSFYPTKPLGAFGDGGAVVTDVPRVAERLKMDRFYGSGPGYFAEWPGLNARLDEVQARLLIHRLGTFFDRQADLRDTRARYDRNLEGSSVQLLRADVGDTMSEYQYVIRHVQRDRILSHLADRNIEAKIAYPVPLHLMPGFADSVTIGDLPNAVDHSRTVLSLPFFAGMKPWEVDQVSESVIQAAG